MRAPGPLAPREKPCDSIRGFCKPCTGACTRFPSHRSLPPARLTLLRAGYDCRLEYYNSFFTNYPVNYLVSTIAGVVFVCLCFLSYDAGIERLRALLRRRAELAARVVDDLLPAEVRDRVMAHLARRSAPGPRDAPAVSSPKAGLLSPKAQQQPELRPAATAEGAIGDAGAGPAGEDPEAAGAAPPPAQQQPLEPAAAWREAQLQDMRAQLRATLAANDDAQGVAGYIADLYPAATVFWADVVGYTAFSSQNTPQARSTRARQKILASLTFLAPSCASIAPVK